MEAHKTLKHKLDSTLTFRLPTSLKDKIEVVSANRRTTTSDTVRTIVTQRFEQKI